MRVSKYEMDGHANANENAKLQFFLKNKPALLCAAVFLGILMSTYNKMRGL